MFFSFIRTYTEIGHLTQNFSPIRRGKNLGHGQLELREYRDQDPKGGDGDDDPALAGAEGYHEHLEHRREQEKRCRRSEQQHGQRPTANRGR